MTSNPQDPIREVPITEIIPPGSSSAPARSPSSPSSDHEHRLPASMPVPPSPGTRSRLPRLIGIVTMLAIIGAGTWYWWTDRTPPVHYKTALVDRGPITSIVTATGTVNPVVSVQVGSQVSGKVTQLMADFNSVVVVDPSAWPPASGGAKLLTTIVGWPTIISPEAVGIAFLFSLIVGIFFGLYPANKASKMNPIEALHYE